MVFSSLTFLYFFLPLSIVFYFVFKNVRVQNFILLLFSFIFYAWGEPVWIILLLFSGLLDYFNGLLIDKFRENKTIRLAALLNSILINLGLLATFKYADFIIQNTNFLLGTSFTEPNILLPVGISFYTFQTLSYTIDVYKGEVKAEKDPIDFLMFVSLFPQLVAGPIVRYAEVAAQTRLRPLDWPSVATGVNRFCLGLFKKVVLANSVGVLVEKYLQVQFNDLSTPEAWFGIVLYSLQLYFDFSGYSDMAIGLGRIFGFTFPENFRHPYAATSVANFYQRWHMTLGRFLRDYVYIPLGGNKKYQIRNILVVWFLTGLWHGASWTFIIWGAYHGIGLVLERQHAVRVEQRAELVEDPGGGVHENPDETRVMQRPTPTVVSTETMNPWLARLLVFHFVVIGWIFFRSTSVTGALEYFWSLISNWGVGSLVTPTVLLAIFVGMIGQFIPRRIGDALEYRASQLPPIVMAVGIGVFLLVINLLGPQGVAPFIYFNF